MSYFPPIPRLTAPDSQTLLCWSLDETAVPFNSTGMNTSLTLVKGFNPSNIIEGRAGVFNHACEFNNTTLTSGDTAIAPSGMSLTVSCWVYCRSFPNPSTFVGKTYHLTGTGWNNPFWSILMWPLTTGVFSSAYSIAGVVTQQDGPTTDLIPLNTWTFLAITYDGNLFKQYLNGNLIKQSSALGASLDWGDGGPWCIGGNQLQGTGGHDGFIDDVRVEGVPRSQSYLERQYKDGVGFYENTTTSGFVPTDLNGAVLWLRSDRNVTVASGLATSMQDQSIYGVFASAPSNAPTYVTMGGQHGLPLLRFDTSVEWLHGALGSIAAVTDLTFFLVARFGDDASRVAIALTDGSFTASSGLTLSSHATNLFRIERWASGGTQTTQFTLNTALVQLYSGTASASAVQGYLNGVAAGTPAGATTGRLPISNFICGANDDTGASELVGDFYEFLLFNRVLGSGELLAVHNYLMEKAGL
jgi:hypothetical protein